MELLPCIIFFVKDAAKAVKQISQQEFKEVADETLTELLGIGTMVGQDVCNSSLRRA